MKDKSTGEEHGRCLPFKPLEEKHILPNNTPLSTTKVMWCAIMSSIPFDFQIRMTEEQTLWNKHSKLIYTNNYACESYLELIKKRIIMLATTVLLSCIELYLNLFFFRFERTLSIKIRVKIQHSKVSQTKAQIICSLPQILF